MAPRLPDEIREALVASPNGTLKVVDVDSRQTFYVVTATVFERLSQAQQHDSAVSDLEPLLLELGAEDWEDLAHYDRPSP